MTTPPLLSVLLPTRNRLEFLTMALQTVMRQDDPDWEVVVSDNASEEDIAGHVAALADPRIRCVRTPALVPVTANWNNALEHATGRYVVMLGDDDGLLPGFVANVRRLVRRFGDPDLVYSSAWVFAYPGVMPDEPGGYLQPYGYASFLRGRDEAFELDRATARRVVTHAMRFRVRYGFNMQFSTISRRLIDELAPRGAFFESAFPDYYATNAAFLAARSIVVDPEPRVVIGVTPKSYGFFHANAREDQGRAFLGMVDDALARDRLAAAMLPGSNINAGWLAALESLRARHPDLLPCEPDHRRFRMLQITHVYAGHFVHGTVTREQLAELEAHVRPWRRKFFSALARAAGEAASRLPRTAQRAFAFAFYRVALGQFPRWNPPLVRGRYATLLDVFESPPASS